MGDSEYNKKDISILTSLLECCVYSEMGNEDDINSVRKAWYLTLASISDTDFKHRTSTEIRAFVRQEFSNQISEIRAINSVSAPNTQNSFGRNRSRTNSNAGSNRGDRRGGPPCRFFNQQSGCNKSEADCRFRHICSHHYQSL